MFGMLSPALMGVEVDDCWSQTASLWSLAVSATGVSVYRMGVLVGGSSIRFSSTKPSLSLPEQRGGAAVTTQDVVQASLSKAG